MKEHALSKHNYQEHKHSSFQSGNQKRDKVLRNRSQLFSQNQFFSQIDVPENSQRFPIFVRQQGKGSKFLKEMFS